MVKDQHDMAKEPEVVDLRLNMFCDSSHLPLVVQMYGYLVTSKPHRHCDFSELAVVLEGTAVSCVPDHEVTLQAGDVLLLGTGTLHYLTQLRSLRNYNVLFDHRLMDTLSGIGRFRCLQVNEGESSPLMHLSDSDLSAVVMLLEKCGMNSWRVLPAGNWPWSAVSVSCFRISRATTGWIRTFTVRPVRGSGWDACCALWRKMLSSR